MPAELHPDWAEKSYLVIDDFSIVHRMLRGMLRKFGAATIDTVKNGPEAIALLQQKPYDVVLCDYHFSEGPNGQQILEEAKHRDLVSLSCIWLMVSSEKAVETVMGAAEQAPDGYILKPLTESLLLARLNRAWDRKQAFTDIDRAYAARDYAKAIRLCDRRLATDKLHAMDLLRFKGNLSLKCGELEQARRTFEQAMAMRDQVWSKTGLAKIHIRKNEFAAAKKLLNEVIRDNPSYLDAYDHLALVQEHLGEVEQAARVLEQASKLSPYSVMRQKNLGETAMKLGQIDLAENAFRMSIEVGQHSVMKTPEAYLGLARISGMKNQPEEALQILRTVCDTFEGDQVRLRAKIVESQVYADNGQPEKARQVAAEIQQTLQQTNSSLGAATNLDMAQLLSATGDRDTSKDLLQAATVEKNAATKQPELVNTAILQPSPPEQIAPATPTDAWNKVDENLPPAAIALFRRALVLIQYMQRHGYNPVTAEEARSVLARADRLAPQHTHLAHLQALLQTLSSSHS